MACLGHKDTMAERALFGPAVAQVSHFECSNERLEMKPGGSEASYEQVRILAFQPHSPVFVLCMSLESLDMTHGMKTVSCPFGCCAHRCKSCGRS